MLVVEIITRGNSSVKIDPTVPAMPTAAATKAQPSALADVSHAAAMTAISASASSGSGTNPVLSPTWTHVKNPKDTTTATTATPVARTLSTGMDLPCGLQREVGGPHEKRQHDHG